jgi:hypothetical protein
LFIQQVVEIDEAASIFERPNVACKPHQAKKLVLLCYKNKKATPNLVRTPAIGIAAEWRQATGILSGTPGSVPFHLNIIGTVK